MADPLAALSSDWLSREEGGEEGEEAALSLVVLLADLVSDWLS